MFVTSEFRQAKHIPTRECYIDDKRLNVVRDTGCNAVTTKWSEFNPSKITGDFRSVKLFNGTVRVFAVAVLDIDTPFYRGSVNALSETIHCMTFS